MVLRAKSAYFLFLAPSELARRLEEQFLRGTTGGVPLVMTSEAPCVAFKFVVGVEDTNRVAPGRLVYSPSQYPQSTSMLLTCLPVLPIFPCTLQLILSWKRLKKAFDSQTVGSGDLWTEGGCRSKKEEGLRAKIRAFLLNCPFFLFLFIFCLVVPKPSCSWRFVLNPAIGN